MKKLSSRCAAAFLTAICLMVLTFNPIVYATEGEPAASVVFTEEPDVFTADPGSTVHISVPVRAYNEYLSKPYVFAEMGENSPLTMSSKAKLTDRYENEVDYINGDLIHIDFDVQVANNAKEGLYKFFLQFQYIDSYSVSKKVDMAVPIQIKVTKTKSEPLLNISGLTVDREKVLPGESLNITGTVKNVGDLPAKDVKITVEGYETAGILPDYTTATKKINSMPKGSQQTMEYPVTASADATPGMKTITIKATYTDSQGNKLEESSSIYIEVKKKKTETNKKTKSDLMIKNIKQSPASPMAGGKLTVSFVVVNKGTADATDIKIAPTGLTETNFSPDTKNPYIAIKRIKAGAQKKLTFKFKVSEKIPEGLNSIGLSVTYMDKNGERLSLDENSNKLYISNIQNPEQLSVGVPRLIISEFSTGKKDLRAGKTFQFTFDVKNTHNSLSADNIKVNLASKDDVFSVTEGSGTFYIAKINPGEIVRQEVELKVKPDCVTQSYPITISFEYEYEGMPKLTDQITTGVKMDENLSFPVLENSRPTVSNIIVGTWDAPRINEACNMSFDFYNMGKSILYNVTAKLESTDFIPTQQTKFIGNVEAGNGNTYDLEITPTVENVEGTGKLIITYEDSNGNSYDVETELPATFINGAAELGPGMDPGMPPEELPAAKKKLLSLEVFIAIQVVLFLAGIIIIRKVVISLYKHKMHKKEDEGL